MTSQEYRVLRQMIKKYGKVKAKELLKKGEENEVPKMDK